MSSLARVLLDRGEPVSGSDLYDSEVLQHLREAGAIIYVGHRAEQVHGADEVVISTAIPADNPELLEARRLGLRVVHRSDLLARLVNQGHSVAVTGAHGKTTTTSMITVALRQAGLRVEGVIGGQIQGERWPICTPGRDGRARSGESVRPPAEPELAATGSATARRWVSLPDEHWVVAEADESDSSFLRYYPTVTVITNIEPDHLEHYGGDFTRLVAAYRQFLGQVKPEGVGVVGVDSPTLRQLTADWPRPLVTYGLDVPAEWSADRIQLEGGRARAQLLHQGKPVGELQLRIPGRHNVSNALAALAVVHWLGLDLEPACAALAMFRGARRRFETVGETGGIRVIDDYAHHPSEIAATIAAARTGHPGRLWAVFQPHRYARTHYLLDQFPAAFRQADEIVMTQVYSPPPEEPWPDVDGAVLARKVEQELQRPVHYLPTLDEVVEYVCSHARSGDLILCMGAGDITVAARQIGRRIEGSTVTPGSSLASSQESGRP